MIKLDDIENLVDLLAEHRTSGNKFWPDSDGDGLARSLTHIYESEDATRDLKIAGAMFLAMAEQDPRNLQRALLVAELAKDRDLFLDTCSVIRVRRNAEAAQRANQSVYVQEDPGLLLDVKPWEEKERPRAVPFDVVKGTLQDQGYQVLRVYASPTDQDPYKRSVLLVEGPKGDLELVKEVLDESEGPLQIKELEHAILMDLEFRGHKTGTSTFLGFLEIPTPTGPRHLMRRTFAYGRTLVGTRWWEYTPAMACRVIRDTARNLKSLHDRGCLYLDLSLSNVLEDGTLFDLSHARRTLRGEYVDTFLVDPVTAAPEVVTTRRAGKPTDIFALGVLFHRLLTGEEGIFSRAMNTSNEVLLYSVPNALCPYLPPQGPQSDLLAGMLKKDPRDRLTIEEVLTWFNQHPEWFSQAMPPVSSKPDDPHPIALVPMRAGVPHNGHINLLCRIMDLGFRPLVALSMAYTWTDRDPVPKWEVIRMLQVALEERGYPIDTVDYVLTPFEDLRTLHLHYLMLPQWEQVAVIVSGNPEVHELMDPIREGRPMVAAQTLCGDLTDANGTRLRTALRDEDHTTIDSMLPRSIALEWSNIVQRFFPKQGDLMVAMPMTVRVSLGEGTTPVLVRRYETPAEALQRKGYRMGVTYDRQIIDPEKRVLTVVYRAG